MLDDLVERRATLIDMLEDKHSDRKAVSEQLESVNIMLGILDDPNLSARHKDPVVEEWEAALIKGGELPASLTHSPSILKKKSKNR